MAVLDPKKLITIRYTSPVRTGWISLLLLFLASFVSAADDVSPVATAQKLFDAMKAHDGSAANALFLPGATLSSIGANGKVSVSSTDDFSKRLSASKAEWLERIWKPKVLEQGAIAVVWAEYDFHLNGKFSHCGIDSFTLLKTDTGWKIASISYTHETSSCQTSPLGPPETAR